MPISVHTWQQSDHFALALGFLDNGFDFFHPTTYTLSLEFTGEKELANPQGITAVDFPLLHYATALIMEILNTRSPIVFRLLSLLWSFIAIWFFFRTIMTLKGLWIAFFLCGFIMFQPIYCYYQDGFHVSSTAFNTFLIGISFLLKYFFKEKNNMLFFGVLFLTLAALMRFTLIIILIALLSMYLLNIIKTKKFNQNILYVFLGILIVLGYFIYNQYLRTKYGSVFLGQPRIPSSLGEITEDLLEIGYKYIKGFIPFIHLFALGVITSLFIKGTKESNKKMESFKMVVLFNFLGVFIFSFLMSYNLAYHDYYSIDTWLPVLILIMIYFIFSIDLSKISSKEISIFVVMFLVGSFSVAFEKQNIKYNPVRHMMNGDLVLDDFKNSSEFLDSNISEDKKVLIICNWGWNTPMIGWNRKVFRVAGNFSEEIPTELNKDYDIIITHDVFFDEMTSKFYPNFSSKVQYINGNGKVSLWKLKN